jgi:hypothetical protein
LLFQFSSHEGLIRFGLIVTNLFLILLDIPSKENKLSAVPVISYGRENHVEELDGLGKHEKIHQ